MIRKGSFHSPELRDTDEEEGSGNQYGTEEGGRFREWISMNKTPSETVNDPDHWIQIIPKGVLVRNNATAETNR